MKLEKVKSFIASNKKYLFIFTVIISAVVILFSTNFTKLVKASFGTWGDTSLVHACKDARGRITIVASTDSCNTSETQVTMLKDVDAGSGLNITRSSSGATISLVNDTSDGWTSAGETWTYASTSTFTITGDQTAKYSKGTRLKFTQNSTVKYAVVVGSSYASPNTTVSILVNTDYTIANSAISTNSYSYQVNPQGYPGWYNLAAPTWYDGIDNGSGGNPTTSVYRINITGTTATIKYIGNATKVNTSRGMAFGNVPVAVANTSNWSSYGSSYVRSGTANYVGSVSGGDNGGVFFIFLNEEILDNATMTGWGFTAVYEI